MAYRPGPVDSERWGNNLSLFPSPCMLCLYTEDSISRQHYSIRNPKQTVAEAQLTDRQSVRLVVWKLTQTRAAKHEQ